MKTGKASTKKTKPRAERKRSPRRGSVEAIMECFGTWARDPEELVRLQKEVDEMRMMDLQRYK